MSELFVEPADTGAAQRTALSPAWHQGMYGCREDMYAASVVLAHVAGLEAELAQARNVLERVRAAVRLIYPQDMTPAGKRVLDQVLDTASTGR